MARLHIEVRSPRKAATWLAEKLTESSALETRGRPFTARLEAFRLEAAREALGGTS